MKNQYPAFLAWRRVSSKSSGADETENALVTTLAGNGAAGHADGSTASARFNVPIGVAVDCAGNLYVADTHNHHIRKITPDGLVSTFCGNARHGCAGGPEASQRFNNPRGIAVDAVGSLYLADTFNHRIHKISPAGLVSILAGSSRGYTDGPAGSARFNSPRGIAVDAEGSLYVADTRNHRIRKIALDGFVSTLAGNGWEDCADGPGASARFNHPNAVAVDGAGNVYVADTGNNRVRKITPDGRVSTLAGRSGPLTRFYGPYGVTVDAAGNVYVADTGNNCVRRITPGGRVSTLAGSCYGYLDGPAVLARFRWPHGVAVDGAGNIYVADIGDHRIRKITFAQDGKKNGPLPVPRGMP
jgi:DNA-binding beta-propeller fold protein YncE